MEPDSLQNDNLESDPKQKYSYDMFNPSNLLQSSWIRRVIRPCNEVDGIFLGYGYNFLLPISIILWIILLITK
jgi:hypothetical protein